MKASGLERDVKRNLAGPLDRRDAAHSSSDCNRREFGSARRSVLATWASGELPCRSTRGLAGSETLTKPRKLYALPWRPEARMVIPRWPAAPCPWITPLPWQADRPFVIRGWIPSNPRIHFHRNPSRSGVSAMANPRCHVLRLHVPCPMRLDRRELKTQAPLAQRKRPTAVADRAWAFSVEVGLAFTPRRISPAPSRREPRAETASRSSLSTAIESR